MATSFSATGPPWARTVSCTPSSTAENASQVAAQMEASSTVTSSRLSVKVNTFEFLLQLIPFKATWKLCIASKKTSSLTQRTFPAVATSLPRFIPINSTTSALGKSSSGSLRARRSKLSLLPPVFLDYHLNEQWGYDMGRLPYPHQYDFHNY